MNSPERLYIWDDGPDTKRYREACRPRLAHVLYHNKVHCGARGDAHTFPNFFAVPCCTHPLFPVPRHTEVLQDRAGRSGHQVFDRSAPIPKAAAARNAAFDATFQKFGMPSSVLPGREIVIVRILKNRRKEKQRRQAYRAQDGERCRRKEQAPVCHGSRFWQQLDRIAPFHSAGFDHAGIQAAHAPSRRLGV